MVQITNLSANDAGLDPAYADVRELEIDDVPLGSGGFGTVYSCRKVNGILSATALVIKILQDDGTGSDIRGFQTIQEFQERIRLANEGRQMRGEPPLHANPAFMGLPLFRFRGRKSGQEVCGYASYRLDTAGYIAFDTLTDGQDPSLRLDYLRLPMDQRLRLAADLAEIFAVLGEEIDYIHADLNAPNLWINLTTGRLTVIDYDGGGIINNSGAQPTTFGKLGDWLAPEILEALAGSGSGSPIPVNVQTDAWSVAVGICYLLFLCPPFVFLERMGKGALAAYFAANRWPAIQKGDPNYNRDNDAVYDWFVDQVQHLDASVRQAFEVTLQEGCLDPGRRISPGQWQQALRGQGVLPVIHLFEADPPLSFGTAVVLRWWVEGAQEVEVTPGLGRVSPTQSRLVFPALDTLYTLTARGLFGTSTALCSVRVAPGGAVPTPVGPHAPVPGNYRRLAHRPNLSSWWGRLRALAKRRSRKQGSNAPCPIAYQGGYPVLNLPDFPWQTLSRRLDSILFSLR